MFDKKDYWDKRNNQTKGGKSLPLRGQGNKPVTVGKVVLEPKNMEMQMTKTGMMPNPRRQRRAKVVDRSFTKVGANHKVNPTFVPELVAGTNKERFHARRSR